ncbi:hypothetical protein [Acinetobacter puyangensis]|uniref:DUF7210 family protein n=1 Tax=Acinetobacter puyangensis TaxID=1096779 RepID=UPI003A4D2688
MSKTVKVKLLKPHTHAGVKFDVDMEIDVPDHDAKWLINTKIAEQVANKTTSTKTVNEGQKDA